MHFAARPGSSWLKSRGLRAQRIRRRLLEAGSVVSRELTERAEAVRESDGGDGTAVPPGSGKSGARHVEPQRSQMRLGVVSRKRRNAI